LGLAVDGVLAITSPSTDPVSLPENEVDTTASQV